MIFNVPQGGSNICHIEVHPEQPVSGAAQPWRMVNTSEGSQGDVDTLDIRFVLASTPQQRQSERMILVFSIAEAVQTATESWRFAQGGVMYCQGKADYLDDLGFALSNDGKTLTASVKCLTDISENFNFSFLGLQKDTASGVCQIYGSADPGGKSGRY